MRHRVCRVDGLLLLMGLSKNDASRTGLIPKCFFLGAFAFCNVVKLLYFVPDLEVEVSLLPVSLYILTARTSNLAPDAGRAARY